MKRILKPFLLGVVLMTFTLIACDNATDSDCRSDYRCFEIPTQKGTFTSKNPSDPCPCA